MMSFFKRFCLSLGAILIAVNFIAIPAYAATPKDDVCAGIAAATGANCGDTSTDSNVGVVITKVVNILSFAVGVTAVIMILIGGLKYILSNGDSANINSAKNTILYALVGLIIASLAQVIVRFVLVKVG